jgi:hypothetical protein
VGGLRKPLSSLAGLSCKPGAKPSHKWLGYFQSRQKPEAGADVNQQFGIAQDLKLLADFVADAAVV